MKDSQRRKLYKVERLWEKQFCSTGGTGKSISFKDTREAQNYATWIWINFKMKIYPSSIRKQVSRVKCFPKAGHKSSCYNGYYQNSKSKGYYKKIKLSKLYGHDALQ